MSTLDEKDSVFHVLSPEERKKVMVVVSPPYPGAGFQKHQVHLLPPSQQKPNPSPEALASMSDLKALSNLSNNQKPTLSFFLPAMQLRSGAQKLAGPGVVFKGKEGSKTKEVEFDFAKAKHQCYIVCSTEGALPELCEYYGGKDQFQELQLKAHQLVCDAERDFEEQRFFHPLNMDESTKQKKLEIARKANKDPNMTMAQCLAVLFENHCSDHESVRLSSNYNEQPDGPKEKGFLLSSNAWYTPKQKPTKEDNDKIIAVYHTNAKKHKFTVNDEIIRGYSLGFRYRQIPCFARTTPTTWEKIVSVNPMEYPARGSFFVMCKIGLQFYDAGSKGRRLDIQEIYIMQQTENVSQLPKAVDPKMHNLPLFKKRKQIEDEDAENTVSVKEQKTDNDVEADEEQPDPQDD